MRVWQVEYMTRPDEREHIEQTNCFRAACTLAKSMSDKHDGSAVVMALDALPGGAPGLQVTGHIEFTFGMAGEQTGTLERVAIPR